MFANSTRKPQDSPGYSSAITCTTCKARVPLALLSEHACSESPGRAARGNSHDVYSGARDSRKGARPANIDTSMWNRDVRPARAYVSPGISPSTSASSLPPASASLSPVYSTGTISKSTSQSSMFSGASSTTSESSVESPSSAGPSSAKLPFFDKYNRVFGDSTSNSPLNTSFSSRSLNNLDRSPPKTAMGIPREYCNAPSASKAPRGPGKVDGRAVQPRSAGLYERTPISSTSRITQDNETIGRAFLQDSPLIAEANAKSSLSYRAAPARSSSNKILAADALDSLLEDLSVETGQTRRPRTSLDAYYFDNDDMTSEDDATPTPRASATAAPQTGYSARSPFARPQLATLGRIAHSAPEVERVRAALATSTPLQCRQCKRHVSSDDSVERDGGRFCGECYAERYLPKCRKCKMAIKGSALSSNDGKVRGKFHIECFNCFACSAPFPNKDFYVFDERPYCAHDYHRLAGSLCGNCGKGVEGQCVTLDADLGNRRYHPECFTCSQKHCHVLLPEYHFVVDGQPYCERHAERRMAGQGRRADKRKTLVRPLARH